MQCLTFCADKFQSSGHNLPTYSEMNIMLWLKMTREFWKYFIELPSNQAKKLNLPLFAPYVSKEVEVVLKLPFASPGNNHWYFYFYLRSLPIKWNFRKYSLSNWTRMGLIITISSWSRNSVKGWARNMTFMRPPLMAIYFFPHFKGSRGRSVLDPPPIIPI